jgi:two-component system response regulator
MTVAPAGPILMIEDDPDDVFLTTHMLRRHGIVHEIVVASDGQAALDQLLPPHGHPQVRPILILLDLHLPGIGGIELLGRLRAHPDTADVPIIVFTSTPADIEEICGYPPPTACAHKPLSFSNFQQLTQAFNLPLNPPPIPP